MKKPRILCLHGLNQSGSIFSTKISGARRKLLRCYDLDFVNGPIPLVQPEQGQSEQEQAEQQFGWWIRDAHGQQHLQVDTPFDYIQEQTKNKQYDAIIGFSQGGLLATALALSGDVSGHIKAVVTAGAPYVEDAFEMATSRRRRRRKRQQEEQHKEEEEGTTTSRAQEEETDGTTSNDETEEGEVVASNNNNNNKTLSRSIEVEGYEIPKLHFAGDKDDIITIDRVEKLSEMGGNGQVRIHDKGHMFPTKASHVNYMMEFLEQHVLVPTKENPPPPQNNA